MHQRQLTARGSNSLDPTGNATEPKVANDFKLRKAG